MNSPFLFSEYDYVKKIRDFDAPGERFGIAAADRRDTFAVWDLETPYRIDPENFQSKGRSTPFEGWEVYGKCLTTVMNGEVVYQNIEE